MISARILVKRIKFYTETFRETHSDLSNYLNSCFVISLLSYLIGFIEHRFRDYIQSHETRLKNVTSPQYRLLVEPYRVSLLHNDRMQSLYNNSS